MWSGVSLSILSGVWEIASRRLCIRRNDISLYCSSDYHDILLGAKHVPWVGMYTHARCGLGWHGMEDKRDGYCTGK